MGDLPDLKKVFYSPREFFHSIRRDTDYIKPWLVFVVASIIYSIIVHIMELLQATGVLAIVGAVIGFILSVVAALVGPFIGAGMIHLGALILGVRDRFIKTFKVVCYGGLISLAYSLLGLIISLPLYLFSGTEGVQAMDMSPLLFAYMVALFLVILIGIVHQFYAEVHGLALYFAISKIRAFFSIILVPLGLMLFFVLMLILILGLIGTLAPGSLVSGNVISNLGI